MPSRYSDIRRPIVLTKTVAAGALLITAATGALATCSIALASPSASPAHLVADHNRNWTGNENQHTNHIRLRIRNRNNNVAVARNDEERNRRALIIDRDRDRDRDKDK
jgi:hypothetical protein